MPLRPLSVLLLTAASAFGQPAATTAGSPAVLTSDVEFKSHDGHSMYGRLMAPRGVPIRAVVVCVHTAEGMTQGQRI
jgi:hypothetical protein